MKKGEARIMLSYARPDEERVKTLYAKLRAEGLNPWMDLHDIPPGAAWRQAIERAVRTCDVFLAFISRHSLDRPGILQGEIKEALDLWEERLDRDSFLIPVRLEDVPPPERLSHLQWVNLFAADGEPELLCAVRERVRLASAPKRRRVLVLICLVAIFAAWGAIWVWNRTTAYRDAAELFARTRPGSPHPVDSANPTQVGITLWRAAQTGDTTPGRCADLKLARISLTEALRPKDRVRLGVEVNRAGYLYVFNREASEGRDGSWRLIFPTLRMRGGDNRVEPGTLVEIPPADHACATFLVDSVSRTSSEHLAILLAPEPIPPLPPREDDYVVDGVLLRTLLQATQRAAAITSTPGNAGETRSLAEEEASEKWTRRLRYNEARPQTIISFPGGANRSLYTELVLKVEPR